MTSIISSLRVLFLTFSLCLYCAVCIVAQENGSVERKRILVVTSFNPEVGNVSSVIQSLGAQFQDDDFQTDLLAESLGCDLFAEVSLWKGNMRRIMSRVANYDTRPDLVVILGQEAMSTYLSMDISELPDIPVVCGMVSRNYIEIPEVILDLSEWSPENHDILEASRLYNVVGGCFYEYDLEKNLNLIKGFFPNVNHIAFLSDNSYGGVSLKAFVADNVNRFPDFNFSWLDGRELTILTARDSIANLSPNSAVLIGTWRFDNSNRYYFSSSLAVLKEANPKIPAFTLTATGINDWAVGSYSPNYHDVGRELAMVIESYFASGKAQINIVQSSYVFNAPAFEEMGLDPNLLPQNVVMLGETESVFTQYKWQIIGIILVVLLLLLGLAFTLFQNARIRHLVLQFNESQSELVAAKELAERNSKQKTAFLTDMSHEIRTPLNAIVGFSEILVAQEDLSKEDKLGIVDIINKNSKQLTSLLNNILDISRVESGRYSFSFEPVKLVDVCKDLLQSVQVAQNAMSLDFRFATDCSDSCEFYTDSQRFQQIVINLLTNAVKFTEKGSVTLHLSRMSDGVSVAVADTGCGIPPEKANDVFYRFVKLDESAIGTGLGLSLCRMICEKLGGRIWVDTSYKQGARIEFFLPNRREVDGSPN